MMGRHFALFKFRLVLARYYLAIDSYTPAKRFKPFAIGLHHRDGDIAAFAGINISNNTMFSFMGTCYYRTGSAIF
jgi:hypothetical protein